MLSQIADEARSPSGPNTEMSRNHLSEGNPPDRHVANAGVLRQHKQIKNQLRLMFIYPIVYFILLVPPFVNHCWLYTNNYSPPFALTTLSVVCLAGQGAVDCLIFMTREKPWRLVKIQRNRSNREHTFRHTGIHINHSNLTPERLTTTPDGGNRTDGPREWWDQDPYSLDASSEGSRGRGGEHRIGQEDV